MFDELELMKVMGCYKYEFGYTKKKTARAEEEIEEKDAVFGLKFEIRDMGTFEEYVERTIREQYIERPYRILYSNDKLPNSMKGFWVKTYNKGWDGEKLIEYTEFLHSKARKSNRTFVFPNADIRRAVSEILSFNILYEWCNKHKPEYQLAEVELWINNVNGNKKEHYSEINNIFLEKDYVMFEAISNGDKVKVCMPIQTMGKYDKDEHNGHSFIEKIGYQPSRKSTEGLYVLEKGKTRLNLYRGYTFWERPDEVWTYVDLFYGTLETDEGIKKGIFYYFNGELISKYAIGEKGDTFYLSNIRANFSGSENNKGELALKNGDKKPSFIQELVSLEPEIVDIKKDAIQKFLEEDITEDNIKEFVRVFEENIIYPNKINFKKYLFERSREDLRRYRHKIEDRIYYYIQLVEETSEDNNIFFWDENKLTAELEIENERGDNSLFIKLHKEQDDWELRLLSDVENKNEVKPLVNYGKIRKILGENINLPEIILLGIDKVNSVEFIVKRNKGKFYAFYNKIEENYADTKIRAKMTGQVLSQFDSDYIDIKDKLFPEQEDVSDDIVIKQVYEAKKIYDARLRAATVADKHKCLIPHLAIMGDPGIGKTTLVKRIAEYFGKEVIIKSSSDLKAAYVGHTGARVYDLVVSAAGGDPEGGPEDHDKSEKIIFIDEAYHLLKDSFGREAVDILLPLMTGDREEIESPKRADETEARRYNFREHNKRIPPIWFAGYEHEMRKMLSENPGLYRRVVKISLTTPSVEGLYDTLLKKARDNKSLRQALKAGKDDIKNYFGWGTSKEHVQYFANYAGVNDFLQTCRIRLEKVVDEDVKRECILEIIDEKKTEIKKQYKAILEDDKSAKFEVQSDIDTTLDELKGYDSAKAKIREIVSMLSDSDEYIKRGIVIPKGMLLVGPPGTGKTLFARALAGEVHRKYNEKNSNKDWRTGFIATISTELSTPEKIKALFSEASEYDTCVIFIDEIDAIGRNRNVLDSGSAALLLQLMKEMDGFEKRKNIFVMAATNAPGALDPALKRPGRFDRLVEISYPELEERKDILEFYIKKLEWLRDEDIFGLIEEIARNTAGYTASDLRNLVNEAAILYESSGQLEQSMSEGPNRENRCLHRKDLNENSSPVEKYRADILEMIERQEIGEVNIKKKEEKFRTDKNDGCSATAIHEVGHALVSILLGQECFKKITVIPRGNALGYVSHNINEKPNTKRQFLDRIKICLGGRAAEELFYGDDISTGAAQDIWQATKIAENMLTVFGMSDKIGPMAARAYNTDYLGGNSKYICSDAFRYEIDEEIRNLLNEQMHVVRDMLIKHKDIIEKLAKTVFDKETMTGDEFLKESAKYLKKL